MKEQEGKDHRKKVKAGWKVEVSSCVLDWASRIFGQTSSRGIHATNSPAIWNIKELPMLLLVSHPPSTTSFFLHILCYSVVAVSISVDEIGHLGRRKVKSRKGRPTCVVSATISCRSSNLVSFNFYFRAAAWMEKCPWQKWNEMPYVGLALNHPIRPRVLRQLGAVELGAVETTETRADKVLPHSRRSKLKVRVCLPLLWFQILTCAFLRSLPRPVTLLV